MDVRAVLLSAALAVAFAAGPRAQDATFTVSGTGDPTETFKLPVNPTPDASEAANSFDLDSIPANVGGSPTTLNLAFFNEAALGGFTDSTYYNLIGDQYYKGPESSPDFVAGVYSGQINQFNGATDTVVVLVPKVRITISGPGDPTETFVLEIDPNVSGSSPDTSFLLDSVSATLNGKPTVLSQVAFFNEADLGGFADDAYYALVGSQYYRGPESDPIFLPGVYTRQENLINGQLDTVAIVVVPELPTWTLMLAGFSMLGAAAAYLKAKRERVTLGWSLTARAHSRKSRLRA